MKILRKNVRYLRKQNKYTLDQLSRILGISKSLLSQFESGCCGLSFENIIKLRDIFRISLDDLIFKDLTKSI